MNEIEGEKEILLIRKSILNVVDFFELEFDRIERKVRIGSFVRHGSMSFPPPPYVKCQKLRVNWLVKRRLASSDDISDT